MIQRPKPFIGMPYFFELSKAWENAIDSSYVYKVDEDLQADIEENGWPDTIVLPGENSYYKYFETLNNHLHDFARLNKDIFSYHFIYYIEEKFVWRWGLLDFFYDDYEMTCKHLAMILPEGNTIYFADTFSNHLATCMER